MIKNPNILANVNIFEYSRYGCTVQCTKQYALHNLLCTKFDLLRLEVMEVIAFGSTRTVGWK